MASCDEPDVLNCTRPIAERTLEISSHLGLVSLAKVVPGPFPDLEHRFPSFASDHSLLDGAPGCKVRLGVPRLIERM